MTSHRLLADWSQWFWPVFANHLWQATLFAFVVWIAVKFFDRAPARFRYFLWMGALAKFLIPSAALVWLIGQAGVDLSRAFKTVQSVGSAAASGIATAYAEAQIIFYFAEPISPVEQAVMTNSATGVTTANHQAEFYSALTIVWLLGAMAFTFQWLIRRRRFARSTRGGRIITSGREFDALKRARSWLFVNRDVGLVVSSPAGVAVELSVIAEDGHPLAGPVGGDKKGAEVKLPAAAIPAKAAAYVRVAAKSGSSDTERYKLRWSLGVAAAVEKVPGVDE